MDDTGTRQWHPVHRLAPAFAAAPLSTAIGPCAAVGMGRGGGALAALWEITWRATALLGCAVALALIGDIFGFAER